MLVRIIPVGSPPAKILEETARALPGLVNVKTKLLPALGVPEETLNHWRKQYDADRMVTLLSNEGIAKFIEKSLPVMFITDRDIYYDGLSFIFGMDDQKRAASIISIARLRPEFYGQIANLSILQDRLIKECVHKVGHHYGLDHCKHPFCVMNRSGSVGEVDKKQKYFCNDCKLKASIKGIELV